jgi:hypothetical protein
MRYQRQHIVPAMQLYPAHVRRVLRALGPRLKAHTGDHHSTFTVHASIPVYHLARSAFGDAGARLADGTTAVFTGRVHHHVEHQYTGERFTAATEASFNGIRLGPVRAVFESPLNDMMVEALRGVANVPGVRETRLLVIPRFYLTALWLHRRDDDLLLLVDVIPEFPLRPGEIYPDTSVISAVQTLMPTARTTDSSGDSTAP